jgi:hypothetical protein
MVESDGRMVKRLTRTANADVEVKTNECKSREPRDMC